MCLYGVTMQEQWREQNREEISIRRMNRTPVPAPLSELTLDGDGAIKPGGLDEIATEHLYLKCRAGLQTKRRRRYPQSGACKK